MSWLTSLAGYAAPIFLVFSPIFSYGDQIMSMSRKKSSAGFSMDIPLIMLVASFLRIFYYPGAHFDKALLAQSVLMVAVQLVLLKVALDHRPPSSSKGGEAALPFAGLHAGSAAAGAAVGVGSGAPSFARPYNFWQWRSPKPYWQFLVYLFVTLVACEVLFSPFPGVYASYSVLVGYIGLSVEATLPLPQIRTNYMNRSCHGFRPSVLVNWLAGDAMKMFWFFTATSEIPLAFKLCGLFQAACDSVLGIQYYVYGSGSAGSGADGPGMGIMLKEKEAAFRAAAGSIHLPVGGHNE